MKSLTTALVIVLCLGLSAGASQLGNTDATVNARTIDDSWSWWYGFFEVPAGGGTIDSVVVYANEGGTSYIRAAVATYALGVATVIDSTTSIEISASNAWVQLVPIVGATINAGDTLLIAFRGDSDVALQTFADAGTPGTDSAFYFAASLAYADAWPSPTSAWDAKECYHGSAYIVYTAGAGPATTSHLTIKGVVQVKGVVKCGD